jgi:hypothetical protein
MENDGIFYGHLEYLSVIWYILGPFGNVVIIWYIFPLFGMCQDKSGNPVPKNNSCRRRILLFQSFTRHNIMHLSPG